MGQNDGRTEGLNDGMKEGRTKQTLNAPLPFYGGGIKRQKCQDFNICPYILHVEANMDTEVDADAGGIAEAFLH